MTYALDMPVLFKPGAVKVEVKLAAHEMLMVASYHILTRVPFLVLSEKGDSLLAYDGGTRVTGDPYLASVLNSHARIVEKLLRDATLGLPTK